MAASSDLGFNPTHSTRSKQICTAIVYAEIPALKSHINVRDFHFTSRVESETDGSPSLPLFVLLPLSLQWDYLLSLFLPLPLSLSLSSLSVQCTSSPALSHDSADSTLGSPRIQLGHGYPSPGHHTGAAVVAKLHHPAPRPTYPVPCRTPVPADRLAHPPAAAVSIHPAALHRHVLG